MIDLYELHRIASFVPLGFMYLVILKVLFKSWNWYQTLVTKYRSSALFLLAASIAFNFFAEYLLDFYNLILEQLGGNEYETFTNRAFGPYWFAYWAMQISPIINFALSIFLWFKKHHLNKWLIFFIILTSIQGAFFERAIIIITSLHRDFLVSSWSFLPIGHWFLGIFTSIVLFVVLVLILQYFRNKINKTDDLQNSTST